MEGFFILNAISLPWSESLTGGCDPPVSDLSSKKITPKHVFIDNETSLPVEIPTVQHSIGFTF
jgi:hypothetical protein